MSITWTDRDGVQWKVRISGPHAQAVPLDYRHGGPAPKDTIIFRGMVDGQDIGYGTEVPAWGDPEELADEELQELLNRAKRASG